MVHMCTNWLACRLYTGNRWGASFKKKNWQSNVWQITVISIFVRRLLLVFLFSRLCDRCVRARYGRTEQEEKLGNLRNFGTHSHCQFRCGACGDVLARDNSAHTRKTDSIDLKIDAIIGGRAATVAVAATAAASTTADTDASRVIALYRCGVHHHRCIHTKNMRNENRWTEIVRVFETVYAQTIKCIYGVML